MTWDTRGRRTVSMMTTVLWVMMMTVIIDVDWRLLWLNCSKSNKH